MHTAVIPATVSEPLVFYGSHTTLLSMSPDAGSITFDLDEATSEIVLTGHWSAEVYRGYDVHDAVKAGRANIATWIDCCSHDPSIDNLDAASITWHLRQIMLSRSETLIRIDSRA